LSRERAVAWTLETVSSHLHLPSQLAEVALTQLTTSGLLCATRTEGPGYRYAPVNPLLEQTVERLAHEYEVHPIHVIKQMNANAIQRVRKDALRTFADAFLLKKDE
jgi:hypothetical protein